MEKSHIPARSAGESTPEPVSSARSGSSRFALGVAATESGTTVGVWALVVLAAALTLFSYGVGHWGWWPVGSNQQALVPAAKAVGPVSVLIAILSRAWLHVRWLRSSSRGQSVV